MLSRFLSVAVVVCAVLGLSVAPSALGGIVGPYTADANTVHLWHFDEPLVGVSPYNNTDRLYPVDAPGVIGPAWRLDDGYYDATYQSGIMGGVGYSGFGGAGVLDNSPSRHNEFRRGSPWNGISPPGGLAPNDSINATQLLGSSSGAFTVEGMIQWDGGNSGYIFKSGDDSINRLRVRMYNAGTTPTFEVGLPNTGGNNAGFTTTAGLVPTLTTTDWYHFALTFDGNNGSGSDLKFYWTKVEPSATQANLVQTFSSTGTTNYDVNGSFQIGFWNTQNFDGLVDEFRISNVARSATEMMFVSSGPPSLTWSGGGSNIWRTEDTSNNWTGSATNYVDGAEVTFGNSGVSAVALEGVVKPAKLTFDNTGNEFILTATSPTADGIAGTALKLLKKGTGKVTISAHNTYMGGTEVEAGTLVIASADALPAGGALTILAGGTVVLSSGLSAAAATNAATSATAVPEPGTIALLAAGLAGLLVAAWRRRRR